MTWEQRWHPLRRDWVVIASSRRVGDRREPLDERSPELLPHAPGCDFCPGNTRPSGAITEPYSRACIFDDEHPSVAPSAPIPSAPPVGIYRTAPARGVARVVCYTPRHDVSLAALTLEDFMRVLQLWRAEFRRLAALPEVCHVLVFEHHDELAGASSRHPHSRVLATSFVPKATWDELTAEREHLAEHGRGALEDIMAAEQEDARRILAENHTALAFVPFFACHPYEVYVAPKRRRPDLAALSDGELLDLAHVLKQVLVRYDNLWRMPLPYVMTLHNAPTDGADYSAHHFYIELHSLRRAPTAANDPGPGPGGVLVRDAAPEADARELLEASPVHYRASASVRPSSGGAA